MFGMRDDFFSTLIEFAVVIFIIWAVAAFVSIIIVESQCLAYGWADANITWYLKGYCIREENEYEITRPLSEILAESDTH